MSTFSSGVRSMDLIRAVNQLPEKTIYLAPKNALTELLETELRAQGISVSGFVDTFQKGENIVTADAVNKKAQVVVLVFSPRYKKEITRLLNIDHVFHVDIVDGCYRFTSVNSLCDKAVLSLMKFKHYFFYSRERVKQYVLGRLLNDKPQGATFFKQALTGKYNKERGFVICNGPSLPVDALELLNDEITIGCNKVYLAAQKAKWTPTFYTIQDELVMRNLSSYVKSNKFNNLVLPSYHLKSHSPVDGAHYFKTTPYQTALRERDNIFSDDIFDKGITLGHTTLYLMIQFLAAIGCKEIYILGADFDYKLAKHDEKQKYLFDVSGNQHFSSDYRPPKEVWTSPKYEKMMEQAEIFNRDASALGYQVFNLSKGSKLPAFPHRAIKDIVDGYKEPPTSR